MRAVHFKSALLNSALAASVLLGSSSAFGQVSLTAGATQGLMPDGTTVPMWGYTCTAATAPTTCAALSPGLAALGLWSPVVITVPTGSDLNITLTNNLSFGSTPNNIPTSLVIVGQLGGGLGTNGATCVDAAGVNHGPSCTQSPDHT